MKGIFCLLLFLLITFSNEIFHVNCPSGKAKVCGCTSCRCVTIPKCPIGKYAKCVSTFHFSGCFCTLKKENSYLNKTKTNN